MGVILEQGSDLATILSFLTQLIIIVLGFGAGSVFGYQKAQKKFINKKEKRLFDNIQRPVAILPSSADKMELENRLLKAIDFFVTDMMPSDARSLDEITSRYRLAIIRYEDTPTFWRIFHKLADKQIPLVIYSKPAEIPIANLEKIQDYYTRYTLCNTPVRLVSDVFAIMSVYPENN